MDNTNYTTEHRKYQHLMSEERMAGRKEGLEIGRQEGLEAGRQESLDKMNQLIILLSEQNRK